jgi:hypothetical protein
MSVPFTIPSMSPTEAMITLRTCVRAITVCSVCAALSKITMAAAPESLS